MTTTSTANIWRQLRTRILTFVPPGSLGTLQTRLGGRLYLTQAPDDAGWPHAIGRLTLPSSGAYAGIRLEGELEIQLYDRPRLGEVTGGITRGERLEDSADVLDMALLAYAAAGDGLTFSSERRRDTLPAYLPPADREVCAIRSVFHLVVWPRYLTQFAPFATS